ncbi:MAG TPA: pyridoxamine 5'-phosphate oxidase [Solirubrobacteraceae bacterium]|nr:pyridoxamine 5'-phosphate oxidase [Solirubrobacteraceae bacterium]
MDPLAEARRWYEEAVAAGVPEANAMALATTGPDGRPCVRFVLFKSLDERGVTFHSNYESRKGRELAANPRAALAVWWQPVGRQVRMEGTVARLPADESDAYFATRPRERRLGAWASRQGSVLPSLEALQERVCQLGEQFGDEEVPRPDWWGGYLLRPDVIELWERGGERLHDRTHFGRLPDGSWEAARLAP